MGEIISLGIRETCVEELVLDLGLGGHVDLDSLWRDRWKYWGWGKRLPKEGLSIFGLPTVNLNCCVSPCQELLGEQNATWPPSRSRGELDR